MDKVKALQSFLNGIEGLTNQTASSQEVAQVIGLVLGVIEQNAKTNDKDLQALAIELQRLQTNLAGTKGDISSLSQKTKNNLDSVIKQITSLKDEITNVAKDLHSIEIPDTLKGDTAFSWGDHSKAGYLTEKDTKDFLKELPELQADELARSLENLEGDDRLDFDALKNKPDFARLASTITGGGNLEVFGTNGKVGSGTAIKFIGSGVNSVTHDGHTAIIDITGGGGAGITDGDKGDITVSDSGSVWSIDDNAVGTDELDLDNIDLGDFTNNAGFITNLSTFDTDDLDEGSTNKYNVTHTGDATGSGALSVVALRGVALDSTVGSPTDGKILVYRSAGSDWVLEDKPTSGSSPDWGDIGGTLSSQTDLQAALDAKADALGEDDNYVTDAEKVVIGNTSGTNTGDQSSIVGITGTKAQFDTAITDGNFLYDGDITQYTDEMAQDAVGGILGAEFTYSDDTPSIVLATGSIDVLKLDSGVQTSLGLADSAIQSADLADVATSGSYDDLDDTPTIPDELTDLDTTVTGTELNAIKSKIDNIEANADVTDTANVTSAGALMDSEVTNLAAVKSFDPTDYATAAQGTKADSALQSSDIGSSIQAHDDFLDDIAALTDPGADAIMGWDDSAGAVEFLTKAEALAVLNVEDGADVTDTTNVTAAGALMDSEVTNLAAVKAFDPDDYASALGADDNYVTDAEKVVIGNTSGTNTGDQTSVTGNAGTATKLATARTIAGVSFDGSANISLNNNAITNGAGYITDYTVTEGDVTAHEDALSITASQVTDFDTEVANNSAVAANTAKVSYPGDASAAELNILDGATLSTTELNYVDGVTSAIQTQLDTKLQAGDAVMGTIVHGATAATARPSGFDVVTWIGSVEPSNATDNDIWYDTSA